MPNKSLGAMSAHKKGCHTGPLTLLAEGSHLMQKGGGPTELLILKPSTMAKTKEPCSMPSGASRITGTTCPQMLPWGPHGICSCWHPKAFSLAPVPTHLSAHFCEARNAADLSEWSCLLLALKQLSGSSTHSLQFLPCSLLCYLPWRIESKRLSKPSTPVMSPMKESRKYPASLSH